MVDLAYNENVLEHKNFADTLGSLQARVVKGTVTSTTANSYYMGAELLKIFPTAKAQGEYFLKCDATGSGSGNSNRSKNRVVVKVGDDGKLVENVAYIWRHDDRVEKLGAGFFKRAEFYRNM